MCCSEQQLHAWFTIKQSKRAEGLRVSFHATGAERILFGSSRKLRRIPELEEKLSHEAVALDLKLVASYSLKRSCAKIKFMSRHVAGSVCVCGTAYFASTISSYEVFTSVAN